RWTRCSPVAGSPRRSSTTRWARPTRPTSATRWPPWSRSVTWRTPPTTTRATGTCSRSTSRRATVTATSRDRSRHVRGSVSGREGFRVRRNRIATLVLGAVVGLAGLSACGDDGSGSGHGNDHASSAVSPAVLTAKEVDASSKADLTRYLGSIGTCGPDDSNLVGG